MDVITTIVITLALNGVVSSYEVMVGPCPVQVDEPCTSDAIKFLFYKNVSYASVLDPFKPIVPADFNITAPTKIIIHGYSGHMDYATTLLAQAYVTKGNVNVIVVDWDSLAQLPCYPAAVVNTWQAGQCTAVLLVSLAAAGALQPAGLHLLGFSLGAHVAAFAANWIHATMGVKVGRITGLDPALPFFATLKADAKLDATDAQFVDIIHTNSGIYGKVEATGHADFYLNGGTFQPACTNHSNPTVCSHMFAPIYFAESVAASPNGFRATHCTGYLQYMLGWCQRDAQHIAQMGEYCDEKTRGIFFGETGSTPPYALH